MSPLSLEDFDADGLAQTKADLRYDAGFADGMAAALAQAAEDRSSLTRDVVQAISELEFTYAEATSAALQGLKPMLFAFVEGILPDLARTSFGDRLKTEIAMAFAEALPGQLEIATHPDHVAAITAAFADSEVQAVVSADPEMAPLTAMIASKRDAVMFDQASALARLRDAVAATLTPDERKDTHG